MARNRATNAVAQAAPRSLPEVTSSGAAPRWARVEATIAPAVPATRPPTSNVVGSQPGSGSSGSGPYDTAAAPWPST